MKPKLYITLMICLLSLSGCTLNVYTSDDQSANNKVTDTDKQNGVQSELQPSTKGTSEQSNVKVTVDGDFDTLDLKIPLNYNLSESEIIENAVIIKNDTDDNKYSKSLKLTGLENVNVSKKGEYEVYVTACDDFECDDESIDIMVTDQVAALTVYNDTD